MAVVQRISNSLSKKSALPRKKRPSALLCSILLTSIVVLLLLVLLRAGNTVLHPSDHNHLKQPQNRQRAPAAQPPRVDGIESDPTDDDDNDNDNDDETTDPPDLQASNDGDDDESNGGGFGGFVAAGVNGGAVYTGGAAEAGDTGGDDGDDDDAELTGGGTVTLSTGMGDIRVRLRSDLSKASVEYIVALARSVEPCSNCRFYRAEKSGILQGILAKKSLKENEVLGVCPEEYRAVSSSLKKGDCPKWDPDCGCHGPIMTRGMVGWAGGGAGPDFFIDMYKRPATHWENQHTVWGEVIDEKSLAVIDAIFELETDRSSGMSYLKEIIHIEPSLK